MTPGFAVFILMNNYFHDVATAMLLASAIALRMMLNKAETSSAQTTLPVLERLARFMTQIFWFSIAWIVVSGIVRAATFREFEWANAVALHHEAGLIAKYVIAVAMMVVGGFLWFGLLRDLKRRGSGEKH